MMRVCETCGARIPANVVAVLVGAGAAGAPRFRHDDCPPPAAAAFVGHRGTAPSLPSREDR
jgi:hypothetical protein